MSEAADTRNSLVALLMAGGSGTRLWPLSRTGRAKQFSALLPGNKKTMLEMTYDRVRALVPPERVFVNVTAGNEAWVEKILPDVPCSNVISAPADRDTLPTLGFATLAIERAVKNPTMLLLASDNWVGDDAALARFLLEGVNVAESGPYLVSIGIRPDHPSVHYGYMKCGDHVFGEATYSGLGYHEKPDPTRAKEYVDDGSYDWNSGMFVWSAKVFWDAMRTHAPKDAAVFEELRAVDARDKDRVSALFARLSRIAVDHGVLEHVGPTTAVQHRFVRAKVPWDDVGRFTALASHLHDAGNGNRTSGSVTIENSSNAIAIASEGRSVKLTGVTDLIVCVDGDDVLVARRTADGRVRDLADESAWPGVVQKGDGTLLRSDVDPNDNQLHGFVKVLDSKKCITSGDSRGVIALVAVENIHVDVRGSEVHVTPVAHQKGEVATTRMAVGAIGSDVSPRIFVDEDRASMSRRAARAIIDTLAETAKKSQIR